MGGPPVARQTALCSPLLLTYVGIVWLSLGVWHPEGVRRQTPSPCVHIPPLAESFVNGFSSLHPASLQGNKSLDVVESPGFFIPLGLLQHAFLFTSAEKPLGDIAFYLPYQTGLDGAQANRSSRAG